MAEQFNHKYELLFGQPVTFYQGLPVTSFPFAPEEGTDSNYILSNYVDIKDAKSLKLEDHHIEFDIIKTKDSTKESKITIYNSTDLIRHWLEAKGGDAPIIILNAGYQGSDLNLLFQGEIFKVRDSFEGATRKTTIILKSGFRNMGEAFTTRSYRKGVKASTVVRDVIADLKLPVGTVYYQDLDKIFIDKPLVMNGKSIEVLKPILKNIGQIMFIEDGLVNVIPENYVERDGRFVFEINRDNLIGSPAPKTDTENNQEKQAANKTSLTVKTTLNGAYQIGNLVSLVSKFYNGVYEIETIKHTGSYEGSDWSTTMDIKPIDGWEVRR